MGRIGDNARQPRDIQNAFFQIEIPGALLLREQAPLEPIGKFGNHALQMGKLLVKLLAQPRQFIRIAKIIGCHHFIELRAEGVVARGVVDLRRRTCRRRPLRRLTYCGHIRVDEWVPAAFV